ncbi:type VII secretion integral membrane protein EccD [Propionicicella superfundia]|uniref:type VII secretion integral membrane protein EccD n=1 Tax=Propionicicella superfundia TaxID=348582 RepID=UPI00041495D2|nr:type VII secretion integral membrane protein EccD [Propionicicella superfundia]
MPYLRVTVIGTRRKADLALPADHPVEELLPEIVALLDEPAAAGSVLELTSLLGVPVDPRASFADQELDSGVVLRLGRADEMPQPPDVAEVTEAVASAAVTRTDRWTPLLTTIALATAIGLTAATAGTLLPLTPASSITPLAVVLVAAAVGGAVEARRGSTTAAAGLFALSAGAALPLAHRAAETWEPSSALPVTVAAAWGLAWACCGLVFGVGRRRRGILPGAAVAVATGAVGALAAAFDLPVPVVAGGAGIIAAALLGLAPSFALAAAGVARLDDTVTGGDAINRRDVTDAITEAFTAQTALVLALTAPLAVSTVLLSSGAGDDTHGWGPGLAAALVVFVLARARLFPLALARIALLSAGALPALWWLWSTDTVPAGWRAGIAALLCAVLVVAVLLRSSAAAQARIRRGLGVAEALSVIAMVPALLGVLGIFGDLLGAFA